MGLIEGRRQLETCYFQLPAGQILTLQINSLAKVKLRAALPVSAGPPAKPYAVGRSLKLLSIAPPSFRPFPAHHDRLACGFLALRAGRAHPPLLAALDASHRPEPGRSITADGRERPAAEAVQGPSQRVRELRILAFLMGRAGHARRTL
jgi:hypothetical protein